MSQLEKPTVIIGAGFVGLFAALHLNHQKYPHKVILIDKDNRFCFKPLLYEYMSGEMESNKVVPLYGELLQGSDIYFQQDTVESIDLEAHEVHLASGTTQGYDNLVLALGSVPAYFAEGAAEYAYTFQSKADVDRLKEHLLECLQTAAKTTADEERRHLLTVAIVGGGPVGVELALTLGDLLPKWYASLEGNPEDMRIVLFNRGDILQGDVNSQLREVAKKAMEERRVPTELLLGTSVTAVRPDAVAYTRNDEPAELAAGTILWACGTQINPVIRALPIPDTQRTRRGHLLVTPTLQLLGHPDVFAAGDCAVVDHGDPNEPPLPPTAQVAYQQGAAIANALKAKAQQAATLPPLKVALRGTLMKLGLGTSVANLFDRYEIVGPIAQKIRHVTYLELLPTMVRNFQATLDWLKDDIFHTHVSEYHDYDYTAGYEIGELATLASALTLSAAAVSLAEIGTISDQLEAVALGRELAGACHKYPDNRVIHALFGHQLKRKLAMQHVKATHDKLEALMAKVSDRIHQACEILGQKSNSQEIQEYKEFLLACCDRVARAAGSGLLGTGQRISPEEATVLQQIRATLDSVA